MQPDGGALTRMVRALVPAALRRWAGALFFSDAVFPRLWRALGPSRAGRLCARFVRPPARPSDGPTYLFIVRDVAYKDLEQLREHSRGNWLAFSQPLLYHAQLAWLPKDFFRQLEFQARLRSDASLDSRRPLVFATSLLESLVRRHGIAAVISSHLDYAHDEFVRQACRAMGIPFVVLLKEHVNTAYGERAWSEEYIRTDFRFTGDAVAVFGPRTREILLENEVCPDDRIAITGPPRFDAWTDGVEAPALDSVVLCAFSQPAQEGAAAFPEVLRLFVETASLRPDLRFVVKCRDQYEMARLLTFVPSLRETVEITHETPMSSLLARAVMVAGFGSLALVEALFADAEVVSIRFGGCTNEEDVQFDERDAAVASVVRFAHTPNEFRSLVAEVSPNPDPARRAARSALLERFFCLPAPTYSAMLDAQLEVWCDRGEASFALADEAA